MNRWNKIFAEYTEQMQLTKDEAVLNQEGHTIA